MNTNEMAQLLKEKLSEKELEDLKRMIDVQTDQLVDAITTVQIDS